MKSNEESKDLDEELLRAARNAPEGDLRAFEELVQHHQKRILANCRYLTRDESIAEDLAQEVFVKAFFGLRGFEGRSSFRHWLQTIKVHHCLNHLKKREGKATLAMDEEAVERYEQLRVQPVAAGELEAVERRKRIDGILNVAWRQANTKGGALDGNIEITDIQLESISENFGAGQGGMSNLALLIAVGVRHHEISQLLPSFLRIVAEYNRSESFKARICQIRERRADARREDPFNA